MCCPRGCDAIKKSKLREIFASEVITSKTISQLSSGAGWHSLILSLGLFLHLMIVSPVMDLLWGLWGCCNNLEAIGQSRISQWIKGERVKSGSSNRSEYLKMMKRTCQNSNLNPLWERPTWSLHCVTALALRDRSDCLQCSTPTWSSSFTWWAFTSANLLIYCFTCTCEYPHFGS